jgi:hypothetical protein
MLFSSSWDLGNIKKNIKLRVLKSPLFPVIFDALMQQIETICERRNTGFSGFCAEQDHNVGRGIATLSAFKEATGTGPVAFLLKGWRLT